MDKPAELDEGEHPRPANAEKSGVADTLAGSIRGTAQALRGDLATERAAWSRLSESDQRTKLREVIATGAGFTLETLVHVARLAFEAGDMKLFNLAFEAFSRVATPLLFGQAWGLDRDDRHSQVQELLLHTFKAIREGKSDYAESHFASFARRKSVSLYRSRKARFEGANYRIEPTEAHDPIDLLPARMPATEAKVLLRRAIDKLPPNQRAAFSQYHLLELTLKEIAAQHEVDESTVRYWLKRAKAALGFPGDPT